MKEILIFAGTTEGRRLSELLAQAGLSHTLCVATEYGEIVLTGNPLVKVNRGRMDREEIRKYLQQGDYLAVVDATHPYARVVTENIRAAMEGTQIPYLRLKRESKEGSRRGDIRYFEDSKSCAEALKETTGNILLTTGSKELALYAKDEELKKRLYVRVLPGVESLRLCEEQGILGRQILALQGPFTVKMNEAMLYQYRISCLVTKESGKAGGYEEKLEAAQKAGVFVFVIGRPQEEGYSFQQVCGQLEKLSGQKLAQGKKLEVTLAGIGMGGRNSLTLEALEAIEEANLLLGAPRLLEGFPHKKQRKPFYLAEQILPCLKEVQESAWETGEEKVTVLFSGDSGFYSGCEKLYRALQEEIRYGGLNVRLRVLPGISSVACLAARLGESYQEAAVLSIHGKKLTNLSEKIRGEKKTFLLLSGVEDLHRLGRVLVEGGLEHCRVLAGYQLSYQEEKLLALTPKECLEIREEGLYICLIKNPLAEKRRLTHGKADGAFLRDRVPMTKEEIREVSICKLQLHEKAVVYDVGSGTGSLAVEIAALSHDLQVFAIEKKEEAVALIAKNQEKFHLENIQVISADAPEGLSDLPMATHAFIGGSGGRMREILDSLYGINPRMRVVINAISMETIGELKEVLTVYPVVQEEIVQIQVSRIKKLGGYHMPQAENPVWICAFTFGEGEEASGQEEAQLSVGK